MKILHLIYTKAIAGAEKYLLNLLPYLKEYDIECYLICVSPPSSYSMMDAYCKTMNDQFVKTKLIIGNKKDFMSISKEINHYLKREKISIIHSHLTNADLLAVIIKKIYNKNIFIISSKHGYDENYLVKYSPEAKPILIDRNLYYYFTKFLLKNINVNLSISKSISDLYYNIKLSSKPYTYIHHGIALPLKKADYLKVKHQLIIVGRLEKMKGHTYLIEAMVEVAKQFPNVKLLILGEGSQKAYLINQAKILGLSDKIIFMGFQQNPYHYIQQSEVIILPSLFEPFGLVYIEAFALKVPVVAFNSAAANEIIVDNQTGLLTPLFKSKILSEKIIHLLQSDAERARIADKAYNSYLENFTVNQMVSNTATWYKSINPVNNNLC